MKFVLTTLSAVGLLFCSACFELTHSATNSSINAPSPPKIDGSPDKKLNGLNSEMLVFDLVLSPEKKQEKVYHEVFDFYGSAKIKSGDEFDIMNEYGFLGKGRFINYVADSEEADGHWTVEVMKESLRSDFRELSFTRMKEMEKENPMIPAYGIFPSEPGRKNIRSGDKVDASEKGKSERKSVFISLPKEIQAGADVYAEKRELEYPNRWADLNGDGKIDFVYIRVRCEEKPYSHCGKYLSLLEGKWTELPKKN